MWWGVGSYVVILGLGLALGNSDSCLWQDAGVIVICGCFVSVFVVAIGDGHALCFEGKGAVRGGEDTGFVRQNEANGTLVFVADDVACSVTECELGVLIILGCELRDAVFDGRSDGVFRELVAFDRLPCVEVEEFMTYSRISSGTKIDAWAAVTDVGGIQWNWIIVDLGVCPEGEPAVFCVVNLVADDDILLLERR